MREAEEMGHESGALQETWNIVNEEAVKAREQTVKPWKRVLIGVTFTEAGERIV